MRIRSLPLLFDEDPDPSYHFDEDPDPSYHFDADLDPAWHFDADPEHTFHFDADPNPDPNPDPDLSYQVKAQTLKKCPNRLVFHTFWLVICELMRIRIHNTDIYLLTTISVTTKSSIVEP